jgi:hypothetical protein
MTFRFFSLTFVISWALFVAAATLPSAGNFAFLLAIFTPALVAIWLTGTAGGTAGLQALFARIFEWRVGVQWYIFAVGYMAAIRLAAALVHRVATGAWPQFGHESLYFLAATIVLSMPVQAGAKKSAGAGTHFLD